MVPLAIARSIHQGLGLRFPYVKRWEKGKTMSGNFNLFNSRKPYSIKHDLSQLQGCWKRLKLQSKKESRQRHKKVKSKVKRSVSHHKTFSWYQPGSQE